MTKRFLILAVFFSSLLVHSIDANRLAMANEIPFDYKKKELAAQQTETAIQRQPVLKFVNIMSCDGSEPKNLCAVGSLEPGTLLTILMKKNKTCRARALQKKYIESEIGSSLGTELETSCALQESLDSIAVVGEPVSDFKLMDYPFINDLKDAKLIESLDKEIKQRQLFKNFIRKHPTNNPDSMRPKIHAFSYPLALVYFADYSSGSFQDAPLILINKDIYYIVSDINECWDVDSQFRLNSRYFIKVHKCTCDTDGCWSEYVEVTKNGFVKITDLPY